MGQIEYIIHGKKVIHDGQECGIYKQKDAFGQDYATMDIGLLINNINSMPKDQAIPAVTQLRDMAVQQAKWTQTPHNLGYPILVGGPERTPIDKVRTYLQNTETVTNQILNALQGN